MTQMREIDIGNGWVKCLPIIRQGTIVKPNYGNQILVRETRKKYPSLSFTDFTMRGGTTFEKLVGKKVKITIEVEQ